MEQVTDYRIQAEARESKSFALALATGLSLSLVLWALMIIGYLSIVQG